MNEPELFSDGDSCHSQVSSTCFQNFNTSISCSLRLCFCLCCIYMYYDVYSQPVDAYFFSYLFLTCFAVSIYLYLVFGFLVVFFGFLVVAFSSFRFVRSFRQTALLKSRVKQRADFVSHMYIHHLAMNFRQYIKKCKWHMKKKTTC